jgi:hypothetical protein
MPALSFHRKGTAVGYMYITTVHREGTGWGWKGHKRAVGSRSGDPGPVVVSGEVYAEIAQAEAAADEWFYKVPNVIELTPGTDQEVAAPRPSRKAATSASPIAPRQEAAPRPSPSTAISAASPIAPWREERTAPVREEANRGLNFFGTATFAILAGSIVYGLSLPDDWPHKIEDIIFGVSAAAAVGWYLWGRNRYTRSLAPLWFLALGVVTKIVGAWMRTGGPMPAGPDLGISFSLLLTGLVFGWQFYATRVPVTILGKGADHDRGSL